AQSRGWRRLVNNSAARHRLRDGHGHLLHIHGAHGPTALLQQLALLLLPLLFLGRARAREKSQRVEGAASCRTLRAALSRCRTSPCRVRSSSEASTRSASTSHGGDAPSALLASVGRSHSLIAKRAGTQT